MLLKPLRSLMRYTTACSLLLLGVLLRLVAVRGDLWADEFWALDAAREVGNWWELFTPATLDGHSSLSVALLCNDTLRSFPRFVPFIVGSITPAIALWAWRELRWSVRLISLTFVSVSYLPILYATEARGYSFIIAGAFLSYGILQALYQRITAPLLISFWLAQILSFFFHYSFIQFTIASACGYYFRVRREEDITRSAYKTSLINGVPLMVMGIVTFVLVTRLPTAGGAEIPFHRIIANAFSVALGGPISYTGDGVVYLVAALYFLWVCFELKNRWKRGDKEREFYMVMLIVAPILLLLVGRPQVLVERYFLLPILFSYPLLAESLSRLKRVGWLLALFLILGNVRWLVRIHELGRGEITEALSALQERKEGEIYTENPELVQYAATFYPSYSDIPPRLGAHPQARWYLPIFFDPGIIPPQRLEAYGFQYKLQRWQSFAGLSGNGWALYEREGE